eukprot:gene4866-6817_t
MGGAFSCESQAVYQTKKTLSELIPLMMPTFYSEKEVTAEEHERATVTWNLILESKAAGYQAKKKLNLTLTYQSSVSFFYTLFYERLFQVHPSSKSLFTKGIKSQGKMLIELLSLALFELNNKRKFQETFYRLAVIHCKIGVKAIEYGIVGEVLFWTLKEALGDDEYDTYTHMCWVHLYCRMLNIMVPVAVEYELENGSSDLQKQRTQHSAATIVTTPSDKKKIGGPPSEFSLPSNDAIRYKNVNDSLSSGENSKEKSFRKPYNSNNSNSNNSNSNGSNNNGNNNHSYRSSNNGNNNLSYRSLNGNNSNKSSMRSLNQNHINDSENDSYHEYDQKTHAMDATFTIPTANIMHTKHEMDLTSNDSLRMVESTSLSSVVTVTPTLTYQPQQRSLYTMIEVDSAKNSNTNISLNHSGKSLMNNSYGDSLDEKFATVKLTSMDTNEEQKLIWNNNNNNNNKEEEVNKSLQNNTNNDSKGYDDDAIINDDEFFPDIALTPYGSDSEV